MRRAARRDATEDAIVAALLAAGATVHHLSAAGVPDLLVGFRGRNLLIEVKQPAGPRGGSSRDGQRLGELQLAWHRAWRGHVAVVHSATEALAAVGLLAVETGPRSDDLPARGSRGRRARDRAS